MKFVILITALSLFTSVLGFGFNKNNGNSNKDLAPAASYDAATGTVTLAATEKKATSCDDIMAKAVVVANEERSSAILERDAALQTAKAAFDAKERIENEMRTILEVKAKLENRLEAIQSETDAKIKMIEDQKQAEIETQKKESDDKIKELLEAHEAKVVQAREEADSKIVEANKNATSIVTETKLKADAQIEAARMEALGKVQEMEATVNSTKFETNKTIERVIREAEIEVLKTRDLAKKTINDNNKIKNETIAAIKNDASRKINAAIEEKLTDRKKLTMEMEKLTKSSREEINECITSSEAKLMEVEKMATMRIESLQTDRNKSVESLEEQIRKQIKVSNETLTLEREEARKAYEKLKEELDANIRDASVLLENERVEASTTIKSMQQDILRLEVKVHELKHKLSETAKNLENLENRREPYCNFTLIRQDSSHLLRQVKSDADRHYESFSSLVKSFSSEYSMKAIKAFWSYYEVLRKYYDESLKDVVEMHVFPIIIPLYEGKLKPFHEGTLKPFYTGYIIPTTALCLEQTIILKKIFLDAYYLVQSSFVSSMENCCQDENLPEFLSGVLLFAKENPVYVFDTSVKLFISLILFCIRKRLIATFIFLVLIPFRLTWFFCPLRFLIPGKKLSNHRSYKTTIDGQVKINTGKQNKKQTKKSEPTQ